MSLEENLRQTLLDEAEGWSAPPELKGKILERITPGQGGRHMKKWLVATIIAASLIIPTGVYAGYNYLADSMYGSKDSFIQNAGTPEQYEELEAKLQQAQMSLNEEDFSALTSLLHELGGLNLKIADKDGSLHPEKLSAADRERYNKLTAELEPYFAKLDKAGGAKAPVEQLNAGDFWDQQLAKAQQTFSGDELAEVEQLIGRLKDMNAKVTDPDGSIHMDRLSDADKKIQEQLIEQLNPYLNKLGISLQPSS
ncbi:DUF3600 domain-containing protein [Paenibacillus sp. HW567]|uniref:DUF3600 domain-containing protein n=1 Tax=Paenibacillus sp. HW567 TaxID=1034769 RepID=UPI00037FDE91|nr:DUF3600 domain-containing protein [Paenibacillus sp. HW567]